MRTPRLGWTAAVLAAALLFAACSDDGDDEDSPEETPTTEATSETTEAESADTTTAESTDTTMGDEEAAVEDLCALVTTDDIETATGETSEDVIESTGLCEWRLPLWSIRLQDVTATYPQLEGTAGAERVSAFGAFLEGQGETAATLGGVGDGAFQIGSGWVFIIAGDTVLLVDNVDSPPDDADLNAMLESVAQSIGTNL